MTYRELQQEVKALREAGYVEVNLKSSWAVLIKAREDGLLSKERASAVEEVALDTVNELYALGEEISLLAQKIEGIKATLKQYLGDDEETKTSVLNEALLTEDTLKEIKEFQTMVKTLAAMYKRWLEQALFNLQLVAEELADDVHYSKLRKELFDEYDSNNKVKDG